MSAGLDVHLHSVCEYSSALVSSITSKILCEDSADWAGSMAEKPKNVECESVWSK